jgi:hypothetical protein
VPSFISKHILYSFFPAPCLCALVVFKFSCILWFHRLHVAIHAHVVMLPRGMVGDVLVACSARGATHCALSEPSCVPTGCTQTRIRTRVQLSFLASSTFSTYRILMFRKTVSIHGSMMTNHGDSEHPYTSQGL